MQLPFRRLSKVLESNLNFAQKTHPVILFPANSRVLIKYDGVMSASWRLSNEYERSQPGTDSLFYVVTSSGDHR